MIMLSGCDYIKDKVLIEEEKVEVPEPTPMPIPKEEDVNIPKIDNMHYFGKDLWDLVPGSISSMKIGRMEMGDQEAMIFPINYIGGAQGSKNAISESSLRKIPRSVGTYIDENSGEIIDLGFLAIHKVLLDGDRLLIAGVSSENNSAKIISCNAKSFEINWEITNSQISEGVATDIIKATDGNYVYIANYLDERDLYYGKINKISTEGKLIWDNTLEMDNTYLYLDQVVEGKTADEYLALGHIYDDLGYKVFLINQGTVVKSLDFSYITEGIKMTTDRLFFVFGTSKKISNYYEATDITPRVTKINADLEVIYEYAGEEVNRFADLISIGESTYLFAGNKTQDIHLTIYFDTGETLLPIKTEKYPKRGVPVQIQLRNVNGNEEYILSGYKIEKVQGEPCEYSFISYLHPLNAITKKMYEQLLNNSGEVRYLVRGEQSRRDIALAIAASEGNDELMYIRYMRSDGLYAFVVTGQWDNPQIVTQYLLKNQEGIWSVLETFGAKQIAFNKIKLNYTDFNPEIFPPVEVAVFDIKQMTDEELDTYISLVAKDLDASDVKFTSYIDEYLYMLFEDGTDYFIVNPESTTPIIHQVNDIDYYNYYLINEEKPPYLIFMQD